MRDLTIEVNGKTERLPEGANIVDLLRVISVDPEQKGIAVAVNDAVVRRPEWPGHELSDTDRVEVIQATQGG